MQQTTAEWFSVFEEHGLWAGPVYSYAELLDDPQVRHNGSFVTYTHPTEGEVTTPGFAFQLSATPPEVRFGAPLVGEQTQDVLAEIGYSTEEVASLLESGAVATTDGER